MECTPIWVPAGDHLRFCLESEGGSSTRPEHLEPCRATVTIRDRQCGKDRATTPQGVLKQPVSDHLRQVRTSGAIPFHG
jgi:hypothetical protein